MVANTSMYGFNPYMMANTGVSDDFMANASGFNNQYAQLAQQQALAQSLALQQQPATDTFQKSEGSGVVGSGLKLAAVGGVGAGLGTYFLGDKLGVNLVKDGKVADELIKSLNKFNLQEEQAKEFKKLYEAAVTKKLPNGMNLEQYKALQQLARANGIGDLAESVKRNLPDDIQTPDAARNKLSTIKIDEIDKTKLNEIAAKRVKKQDLNIHTERLNNLQSAKNKLKALGDNPTKAEIEQFIKANPEAFGLKGKNEAKIAKSARKIANNLSTKESLSKAFENKIKKQTERVENLKNNLKTQVTNHWDDTAKAFKADAPEALTKAAKNFKWSKAGKYGAIAAGVGLVLGWMFGGKK